ncbi:hypothetical protein CYMTET_5318 [Cymbomonas tetramitiformis]|uniref:Uncharacterized protein n=1 Tax=Cymbomonas tetramitiformis TaxID=36881 RepID=A0AAE0GZN6_9CHLO|nr:hypothetical protein CYMTET_5318 [Cymbomonas tetramitiformis]
MDPSATTFTFRGIRTPDLRALPSGHHCSKLAPFPPGKAIQKGIGTGHRLWQGTWIEAEDGATAKLEQWYRGLGGRPPVSPRGAGEAGELND